MVISGDCKTFLGDVVQVALILGGNFLVPLFLCVDVHSLLGEEGAHRLILLYMVVHRPIGY